MSDIADEFMSKDELIDRVQESLRDCERYKTALETIISISDKHDPLNSFNMTKIAISALHFPEVDIVKLSEGTIVINKAKPSK